MPFELGSIVTLKSHPFDNVDDFENILLGGEILSVPPLMVVIEKLISSEKHDETGREIGAGIQLKCIWFSTKSGKFENAWFNIGQLKSIVKGTDSIEKETNNHGRFDTNGLSIGDNVILETGNLEIRKRKSSLDFEFAGKTNKSRINAFLGFIPPVMTIIGFTRNTQHEPLFNTKTGAKNREVCIRMAKCKYFNQVLDKFSEEILPLVALTKIRTQPELDTILLAIKHNYIVFLNGIGNTELGWCQIQKITSINGSKRISCNNLSTGETKDYMVDEISIKGNYFENEEQDSLPIFKAIGSKLNIINLDAVSIAKLKRGTQKDSLFLLDYCNSDGVRKQRLVKNLRLVKNTPLKGGTVNYLEAFCIKNQQIRHYKAEGIRKLSRLKEVDS